MQVHADAIKIEALAKLGEILKNSPKAKGVIGQPGPGRGKRGNLVEPRFSDTPTLSDLGLSKKTSAMAQKLAELPEKKVQTIADQKRPGSEYCLFTQATIGELFDIDLPQAMLKGCFKHCFQHA